MTGDRLPEIRRRLDRELSIERFEADPRPTDEAATRFFRDLFVRLLDFDASVPATGQEPWTELPVQTWGESARTNVARVFARAGSFRVVYVELERLSRTAERTAIRRLARSETGGEWATGGSFLAVFHAPGADTWHLVTPYEEGTDDVAASRPVLRRFALGAGATHRTVSRALHDMGAGRGRLGERIDRAFDVEPVIEGFHEDYGRVFDTLSDELRDDGLDAADADRYAHVTLARLLACYFLQAGGGLGGRTDFVRWFHDRYEASDDADAFHETWLAALFFDGVGGPPGEPVEADLPGPVERAIAGIPRVNGALFRPTPLDETDAFLSDAVLKTVVREFLEEYTFTVTERRPSDVDVAVDPSTLGAIYETFVAGRGGEAGVVYTPRTEVDLMCRLALYEQVRDRADAAAVESGRVVEFVFGDPQEWDPEIAERTAVLEAILHDLRIVDPACGSGAFLVGMKRVLSELHGKLGTSLERLGERIVVETLFGVDVDDWAVRVAEFRLWLSLVDGSAAAPPERQVLTDVSVNLESGDSLVRTTGSGGLPSFHQLRTDPPEAVDREIDRIEAAKSDLWRGRADDPAPIERRRTAAVACLDDRIASPADRVPNEGTGGRGNPDESTGDGSAGVESTGEESAGSAADVERELRALRELRDEIASGERREFGWELDFPEVLLDGGFDVVIGNPPYVRQTDIHDRGVDPARPDDPSADEVGDPNSRYGERLREFVERRFDVTPYETSDLYVYFFVRGVDLLREGGTLSFVTSSSWLDVDYGVRLQEFLLREGEIEYVFENRSRRTFTAAAVNTIVSVVNRGSPGRLAGDPSFVAATEGYGRFVAADRMRSILVGGAVPTETLSFGGEAVRVRDGDAWRSTDVSAAALWRLGGGTTSPAGEAEGAVPQGQYRSGKWGKFTRAPRVFFELTGESDRNLTRLGTECEVRRGTRTGANQFFYLPSTYYDARPRGDTLVLESTGAWPDDEYRTELALPREYWMHETDEGWEPNLVLKTSRSFDAPIVDLDALDVGEGLRYLLVIDEQRAALEGDVEAYVSWGEDYDPGRDDLGRTRTPFPTSVSDRGVDWYDLASDLRRGDVLPMKNVDARHVYWLPDRRTWIDDRLHGIRVPGGETERRFLAGILNSTYGTLSCEVNGRVNLGQGALDVATDDHRETLIPPLDDVDEELKARIAAAFETVGGRRVTSIFDELGTRDPARVSFDSVAEDRLELDRLVVRELLGLDEATHRRVYEGTLELVRQRIEKAESG